MHFNKLWLTTITALQHHDIHVDLGRTIFDIRQIKNWRAIVNANAHRRTQRMQRMSCNQSVLHHSGQCIVQRDVCAANAGGSRATVGLQNIAVDNHLPLAEQRHVTTRTQRPTNQSLNLNRAATLFAFGGFAIVAVRCRARQHRIFSGDPTFVLAFHPSRHVFINRCSAQHPRLTERDKHRTSRHLGEVTLKLKLTQFICFSSVWSCHSICSVLCRIILVYKSLRPLFRYR